MMMIQKRQTLVILSFKKSKNGCGLAIPATSNLPVSLIHLLLNFDSRNIHNHHKRLL
jgi:hypothetical protein